MPSPYNLKVHYNCVECTMRAERRFCNMSDSSIEAVEAIKYAGVYPKGSLLFVEGEEPRGVYILCSGRAKLTSSSSEGKRLILKIVEAGEVLGLSSAILGCTYDVSAETIEPSQVNFIKRDDFLQLLAANTEACFHTAEQLSEKYHAAQREIRSLGLAQTTTEKLARLLLDWVQTNGEETSKGVRLKVLLTHEEIAQMVGTTRETITRLFSNLKRRGIVTVKGSTVFVADRTALESLVSI
ncbi:MAG TPA: Crp/Fnr family transcriptional regulator [Thermoanaerobaculia bacterium]|nr:Crp/Fnr family transcriptional regulator [Thermoanaerobaculia bacterium]